MRRNRPIVHPADAACGPGGTLEEHHLPHLRAPAPPVGLRNIETAALAYNGTVSVSADDRWFSLRVLFPQQDAEASPPSA